MSNTDSLSVKDTMIQVSLWTDDIRGGADALNEIALRVAGLVREGRGEYMSVLSHMVLEIETEVSAEPLKRWVLDYLGYGWNSKRETFKKNKGETATLASSPLKGKPLTYRRAAKKVAEKTEHEKQVAAAASLLKLFDGDSVAASQLLIKLATELEAADKLK